MDWSKISIYNWKTKFWTGYKLLNYNQKIFFEPVQKFNFPLHFKKSGLVQKFQNVIEKINSGLVEICKNTINK